MWKRGARSCSKKKRDDGSLDFLLSSVLAVPDMT
jgi:hypothetical protein